MEVELIAPNSRLWAPPECCLWNELPSELHLHILSFLHFNDLCILSCVASWMHLLCSRDEYWYQFVETHPCLKKKLLPHPPSERYEPWLFTNSSTGLKAFEADFHGGKWS
mgnify:FL=1